MRDVPFKALHKVTYLDIEANYKWWMLPSKKSSYQNIFTVGMIILS